MTAEIAILNRSGIALAADSAVTIGKERVWKNTNKLFSLGPTNDIGIMIYGNGDFNGFHWETVIKSYREHIKSTRFKTIEECKESFFQYLINKCWSDDFNEDLASSCIILSAIEEIKSSLEDVKYETKNEFRANLKSILKISTDGCETNELCIGNLAFDEFSNLFKDRVLNFSKDELDGFLTKPLREALMKYVYQFFVRSECYSGFETGVVFAGFGEDEYFPCLIHCTVDGRINNHIRIWEENRSDLNKDREQRGIIVPFAQKDMIHLFMEGIAVNQIRFVRKMVSDILDAKSDDLLSSYVQNDDDRLVEDKLQKRENKNIVDKFMKEFSEYRIGNTINPMMKVVSTLPKEEMADMAASLVEITSLRRKVDSKIETVGGPVDVAIISKGDGFVWIRRKNYFDIDLNMDYYSRRKRRLLGTE